MTLRPPGRLTTGHSLLIFWGVGILPACFAGIARTSLPEKRVIINPASWSHFGGSGEPCAGVDALTCRVCPIPRAGARRWSASLAIDGRAAFRGSFGIGIEFALQE